MTDRAINIPSVAKKQKVITLEMKYKENINGIIEGRIVTMELTMDMPLEGFNEGEVINRKVVVTKRMKIYVGEEVTRNRKFPLKEPLEGHLCGSVR